MKKTLPIFLVILSIFAYQQPAEGRVDKIIVVIPEYHMDPKDSGRIFPENVQPTTQGFRSRIPDPSAETEVIKSLLEYGFYVVDQNQMETIRYSDQVKATINGESDLAILLGQQFNADIMITGEAISQSTGNSFQGLFSCRARLEVKIIDLKSGRLLFADGLYASSLDRSEIIAEKNALQKAGYKMGKLLVDKINKKNLKSTKNVQLIISGLSFKDFIIYKETVLEDIEGVKIIEQKSFIKAQCFLTAQVENGAETFASNIVTKESKLFVSKLIEMSQESITISASRLKKEALEE